MVEIQRKRIGLFFLAGENWLGGVYYIQNIIKALTFLEEEKQPIIVLFCNKQSLSYADNIKYNKLEIIDFQPPFGRLTMYLKSVILGKNLFVDDIIESYYLDGLFPLYDYVGKINGVDKCKIISWYPDLQHKVFPEYFKPLSRILRDFRIHNLIKKASDLVVSSQDTYNHFKQFYRIPGHLKIHILNFAVVNDDFLLPDYEILKEKYSITQDYFIVSNQFYEHKNHLLLFKAVKLLKDKGIVPLIFLTGKFEDYKNPDYIATLITYLKENKLEESLKPLGIIPREEQLSLMKYSLGLIQPSKFEGWNTSIEDAKSLGVQVICSSINVHKEQMGTLGHYFNVDKELELAEILQKIMEKKLQKKAIFTNYKNIIYDFGNSFLYLFN